MRKRASKVLRVARSADRRFIEVTKALLGKWRWRTKFAGTEGLNRTTNSFQMSLDAIKSLCKWHGLGKTNAMQGIAGLSSNTCRILRNPRHITIPTRFKHSRCHIDLSKN
jgi:hypothetical protein